MTIECNFKPEFHKFITAEMRQDLAHDLNHVLRVVQVARALCREECGQLEVVVPAAYLHDCVSFPKNHPHRKFSSAYAADKALSFLSDIGYPAEYFDQIHHAIHAHSFSAGVKANSLDAQIVQDADRLDALGAVGIARCLQVSSQLERPFYQPDDPFCEQRMPDDGRYTLDYFYTKLLHRADKMHTRSARQEAERRTQFMRDYLQQLGMEIAGFSSSD
jgi:uncharacterized protein